MKKLLYILSAVTALMLMALSCSKVDPDDGGKENDNAPSGITLSEEQISVDRTAQQRSLTVTAPSRPKAVSDSDWLTIVDGTYSSYSITYTLNIAAFGEYGTREAVVTITSGSLTKTVKVIQTGREKPQTPDTDLAKDPVTDGITLRARALYDYLMGQYGEMVISSIMANVNWNTEEAQKVFSATGKWPAMNCFDFIHMPYSGANWINYSDISPVRNWWNAGGIVSLMWHFNVPQANGSAEYTCTPSATSFKASNALVEGTWENIWFYDQMGKVADVILQLQEAGIPAIWRPFHEAAGNYYARNVSWNQAWFWWGTEGPEVFRQLWNTMQDYFYAKGIRNLLWVWTAQSYNGNPTVYDSDGEYYPGDGRVDIVARDLYGCSAEENYTEYVTLQAAYPHKMIVLGECGLNGATPFASIPDAWLAGAHWGWFMPWYGSNMPGGEWWSTALSSEYVISRDELPFDLFE